VRSVREAPEILQHLFADVGSSFIHIFDCGQLLDSMLPLPEHPESDVVQVRRQHPADIVELLQSGGEIQIIGLLRHCGY